MKLYFTLAQIPELANLPIRQRRIVYRAAYSQLWHEHRQSVIYWYLALGLIWAGAAMLSKDVLRPSGIKLYWLIEIAICCVAMFIFYNVLTERLRPYYRKYLSEHPNEFGQTDKQA